MFEIAGRKVGRTEKPLVIAEISANHNGSIDSAKRLIQAARDSNAGAVKLQTYSPDTMTIDSNLPDFVVRGGPWDARTLYDLYSEAQTPFSWHKELFDFARSIGILMFSTPFDETAVSLLQDLDAPAYKIASFEITDLPLIKAVAQTGKPLFMSTGMASKDEIAQAVDHAKVHGCKSLLLFHCISSYPAPLEQANLSTIQALRSDFGVEVGLSDHTLDHRAAQMAVALGATAIEKHFTLDRSIPGPDSFFSITPPELSDLVQVCDEAWEAVGSSPYKRPSAESGSRAFRRSIYFVEDVDAGEVVSTTNTRIIRPGFGLEPKFFDQIQGARLSEDVKRGQPVTWDKLQSGSAKVKP